MLSRMFQIARSEGDPRIISSGPSSMKPGDRMARHLGWFSIGLGVIELIGAGRLSRALGIPDQQHVIRAFGVREIASGVLSLSVEKKTGIASRVVGDVLDLAVLSRGLGRRNPKRRNAEVAVGVVAAVTLLDFATATVLGRRHARGRRNVLYTDRSGFPRGLSATRKAVARSGEAPVPAREATSPAKKELRT